MSIRTALIAAILTSLALPAAAGAKEVQSVRLCGASRCFTFDRGNSGGKLMLFRAAGAPAAAPARAAGWYRLRTRIGGEGMKAVTVTSQYVPGAGLIRVNDVGGGGYAWYAVNDELRPVLRRVASRLAPRSAASLHVSDIAPGVPGPTATPAPRQPRDSGAGSAGWIVLGAAVVASGGLLIAARRGHGNL